MRQPRRVENYIAPAIAAILALLLWARHGRLDSAREARLIQPSDPTWLFSPPGPSRP